MPGVWALSQAALGQIPLQTAPQPPLPPGPPGGSPFIPGQSPPPIEPAIPVHTVQFLLTNALTDAGVIGVDEQIEQPILNRAFRQANGLLAQWARKRWLVYRIQDYSVVSTGQQFYFVGLNANININPRPDRLEYAFLRILNLPSFPVDVPLEIIQSQEDYARIVVKNVGTLSQRIRYDPVWPVGVLYPWPVPQASLYEIHVGFKVVLPRFSSLAQSINLPPEYEAALNFCLARRFRASYQLPADATIDELARDTLNTMRLANQQMATLEMPRELRRPRAYDYRGDTDSF